MPKIPTYTAQGPADVLRLPRTSGAPAEAFGAELGQELTRFGGKMGEIADEFQRSKDELEALTLKGEYDAAVKNAALELQADPEYDKHPERFFERSQQIQKDVESRTKRGPVQRALQGHFARTLPLQVVDVKDNALKLMHKSIIADMDRAEDALSRKVAEGTTEDRDEAIREYHDIVSRNASRGTIDAVNAEKRRQSFEEKSILRQMDILRRTDRSQLRKLDREGAFDNAPMEKRLKILEDARRDEEHEDNRNDRIFKKVQEQMEFSASARANRGDLTDAELNNWLSGRDPYITPDKARTLKQINESPPTGEGNTNVRAIMQEYHSGARTEEAIEKARVSLKHLIGNSNRPNVLVDKAFNELQSDQMSLRTVQAAEMKAAEDIYKVNAPPIMPGKLGQFQRNQQSQDIAEIRTRIRRGVDPQKAVEDVLKKRATQTENTPDKNKSVIDLSRD